MVLAVLQRRAGVKLGKPDVFAATVGGVRLTEPAADLAVALALASVGARTCALPHGLVAIGEVGLAGEVRRVGGRCRAGSPRPSGWAFVALSSRRPQERPWSAPTAFPT